MEPQSAVSFAFAYKGILLPRLQSFISLHKKVYEEETYETNVVKIMEDMSTFSNLNIIPLFRNDLRVVSSVSQNEIFEVGDYQLRIINLLWKTCLLYFEEPSNPHSAELLIPLDSKFVWYNENMGMILDHTFEKNFSDAIGMYAEGLIEDIIKQQKHACIECISEIEQDFMIKHQHIMLEIENNVISSAHKLKDLQYLKESCNYFKVKDTQEYIKNMNKMLKETFQVTKMFNCCTSRNIYNTLNSKDCSQTKFGVNICKKHRSSLCFDIFKEFMRIENFKLGILHICFEKNIYAESTCAETDTRSNPPNSKKELSPKIRDAKAETPKEKFVSSTQKSPPLLSHKSIEHSSRTYQKVPEKKETSRPANSGGSSKPMKQELTSRKQQSSAIVESEEVVDEYGMFFVE